jgi:hypothetical protein
MGPIGEPAGERGGDAVPRLRWQVAATGEAGEQAEPLVVERDAGRGLGLGGGLADARDRGGRPVPHHDRAGDQVAETLSPRMERDQPQAEEVGRRQGVGDPEQVPDHGRSHGHRVARVLDHADAHKAFPRRLPRAESLEQDEVSVPEREPRADEERREPGESGTGAGQNAVAGEKRDQERRGRSDAGEDDRIEHRRQQPGAHARDFEIEHDVLGSLDFEVLAVVGGGGHWRRDG